MPKRTYNGKLTNEEIIALFDQGAYKVNPEKGIISRRDGRKLYTFFGGKEGNGDEALWCRLYSRGKMRSLPVAHCIWMYKTHRSIPDGFEVHHRNTDKQDNRWKNLFCLFSMDHRKLHLDNGDVEDLLQVSPF